MSYILEALKKADQERIVGKVPDLDSVHDQVRPAGRKSRWIWILAALLVVNGILVAAYLLRNDAAGDGPERASVAPVPSVETAPPVATPAIPTRSAVTTRQPVTRSPVRSYVPPAARPAPADEALAAASPPLSPPVTPKVAGTVIRAEKPLEVGAPVPEIPAAAPVARPPAPAGQAATSPPAESAAGLPYWDDLSLEFRSGFTTPRIDVHVYDTNPRRRFILVNLKKFREGERLDSGALLEQITPEGVQLSFRGKQFIYRQ